MKGFFTNIASIFGTGQSEEELQAESDRLDALKDQLDIEDRARLGDEWYAQVQENNTRDTTTYHQDVFQQIDTAFDEGWEEGKDNVAGAVRGPFNVAADVVGSVLRGVPWFVWAGVAAYFFFSLGGASWLRRKAAK